MGSRRLPLLLGTASASRNTPRTASKSRLRGNILVQFAEPTVQEDRQGLSSLCEGKAAGIFLRPGDQLLTEFEFERGHSLRQAGNRNRLVLCRAAKVACTQKTFERAEVQNCRKPWGYPTRLLAKGWDFFRHSHSS